MAAPLLDVRAYAALLAALANAGPSRAAVLGAHGLDEASWGELDDAWQAQLSGALDDEGEGVPALIAAFDEAFTEARAAGTLPLDLARFAAITRRLEAGADLEALLRESSLGLDDLAGANAYWRPRLARDEDLRARFEAAMSGPAVGVSSPPAQADIA